jgi:hypothetical protein
LQVTGSSDLLQGRLCSGSLGIPHHAEKIHRDGANCVKQSSLSARLEMSAGIAEFATALDVLSHAEQVSVVIDRLETIQRVLRGTNGNT